jgi:hypothetical protein
MDLIEDYLRAVAALLPKAQRDDIVAELRDTILTRQEEREAALGRPLTPDEIEAVLREIGHPLVVAARYGEGPQHVVGPMLYPYWLFGVKAVLVIQAVVAGIVFVTGAIGYADPASALGRAVATGVTGAATLIGFATVACWLIERYRIRIGYLDTWHVRDLRAFTAAAEGWGGAFEGWRGFGGPGGPGAPRPAAPDPSAGPSPRPPHRVRPHPVQRPPWPAARGVGLMAWSAVLLLWWSGGLRVLGPEGLAELRPAFDPGALASTDWTALKADLYGPVLAYILAMLAQGAVLAAWPQQVRLHGLMDMVMGAALLVLALWLWNAPALAPSVQVDSVAGFVGRMIRAFAHGPPFPLPAVLTGVLVFAGFGAVCRMIQGLFEALLPGGRRTPEPPPVGGRTAGL